MGTRGVYGFRKNGEDKLAYNHYDSYPEWLGEKVIKFVNSCSIEELNEIYDRIILVDEGVAATPEQIEECKKYADTGVSTGELADWYCLLRNTQGNLTAYKDGLKYMIDNNDFIKYSLFCEYGYIINLDNNRLEFWLGFQKEPCEDNRYGTEAEYYHGEYYPCKMVAWYNFSSLMELGVEAIVEDMVEKGNERYEEEDE